MTDRKKIELLCDRPKPTVGCSANGRRRRCTDFSHLFWNEILHVSDNSSLHHQEFFTVHTAMVYAIQVCRQLSSRIRMELSLSRIRMELSSSRIRMELSSILILLESCLQTCVKYTIAVPEKLLMMDRRIVEFHSKINFRN